jgi:hypothetical protein
MAYEQEAKFLAEANAKRVSYYCSPRSGGKRLVRRWTTTRIELMSSCLTYLNTIKTVTNPKADGKEYPGVWRVISNTGPEKRTDPNEQGITQTLGLGLLDDFEWSSSFSTLDNGYSYSYRDSAYVIQAKTPTRGEITEARNTLNQNMLYDGDSSVVRSHPYYWTTRTSETALATGHSLDYKNYHTRPEAPSTAPQGTAYAAKSTLGRDGTYDGGIDYKTSKPRAWSDVTNTVMGAAYAVNYLNARTRPQAPAAPVLAFSYDAKTTINEDDTYSGNVNYDYSKPAEWVDETNTTLDTRTAYSYLALRSKPTAPAGTAQGFIYDPKSTLNKDGTYNGGITVDYSKPAEWADRTETTTGTSVGHSYLNQRDKPSAPTVEAIGFVYQSKSTLNRDGTFNGDVGYDYSKPAEWSDRVETTLSTSVAHNYISVRAKPTAPAAPVQGFLFDGKSTLNKDGTYNGQTGYQYSKPDTWTDRTETALGSTVAHGYLNQRNRPTAPGAAVQGYIFDAKTTDNPDGTYNGNVGYQYSKPDAWVDRTEDYLNQDIALSYLNYRTRPTAPSAPVLGALYGVKTNDNKDGTYSGDVKYSISKPIVDPAQVSSALMGAGYAIGYQNSRTKPVVPVPVLGWVYETKSTLAKDGSYNGETAYSYEPPVEAYVVWKSDGAGITKGLRRYKNWHTLPSTIAELTYMTNNGVHLEYAKNGTMDVTVRIEERRVQTGGIPWWRGYSYSHDYENRHGQRIYVHTLYTDYLGAVDDSDPASAVEWVQSDKYGTGCTVIGEDSGHQTGIIHLGGGKFRATRVERED